MAKQLSLIDRITIENMIHRDYTFASIARNLERYPSTIDRKVLHYRCFTSRMPISGENNCINKSGCRRNLNTNIAKDVLMKTFYPTQKQILKIPSLRWIPSRPVVKKVKYFLL